MHGEFLLLLFLQAHQETEDYFYFMVGLSSRVRVYFMVKPAQPDQDQFRFRTAALYSV